MFMVFLVFGMFFWSKVEVSHDDQHQKSEQQTSNGSVQDHVGLGRKGSALLGQVGLREVALVIAQSYVGTSLRLVVERAIALDALARFKTTAALAQIGVPAQMVHFILDPCNAIALYLFVAVNTMEYKQLAVHNHV